MPLGAILWGIGASMALAEERTNAKTKSKDEEIEELKLMIEKMKSCENCKHCYYSEDKQECKVGFCERNEKWELRD